LFLQKYPPFGSAVTVEPTGHMHDAFDDVAQLGGGLCKIVWQNLPTTPLEFTTLMGPCAVLEFLEGSLQFDCASLLKLVDEQTQLVVVGLLGSAEQLVCISLYILYIKK